MVEEMKKIKAESSEENKWATKRVIIIESSSEEDYEEDHCNFFYEQQEKREEDRRKGLIAQEAQAEKLRLFKLSFACQGYGARAWKKKIRIEQEKKKIREELKKRKIHLLESMKKLKEKQSKKKAEKMGKKPKTSNRVTKSAITSPKKGKKGVVCPQHNSTSLMLKRLHSERKDDAEIANLQRCGVSATVRRLNDSPSLATSTSRCVWCNVLIVCVYACGSVSKERMKERKKERKKESKKERKKKERKKERKQEMFEPINGSIIQ